MKQNKEMSNEQLEEVVLRMIKDVECAYFVILVSSDGKSCVSSNIPREATCQLLSEMLFCEVAGALEERDRRTLQ